MPEYGVRGKRGDFEPLISEELFYQVQAVLSGRIPSTAPRQRLHPDFLLRGFVRCKSCGRGLTGSWSKGRNEYYAYYHCRPGCRAVNVAKSTLEGLFADELALLQPTPGYMRLLRESVLQIWKARKTAVREELDRAERAATSDSGSNNCSFQTEFRSTEKACSNRRNRTGFQLLAGDQNRKRRFGGPEQRELEPNHQLAAASRCPFSPALTSESATARL